MLDKIRKRLSLIYEKDVADVTFAKLKVIMDKYKENSLILEKRKRYHDKVSFSEKDSILITYADSIQKKGEKPLRTLHHFLKRHVGKAISGVHILPFYPSSSDGGFSVVNYKAVDPSLGSWHDIKRISDDYRIMADFVLNHISVESYWFKRFLSGDGRYWNYFIHYDKKVDTSNVFRPRTTPLLTRFVTKRGPRHVWTTFSRDQADLNYGNPDVLNGMVDVMLSYISKGVDILRLDAVGFLWKDLEKSSFHLKQTHEIVKLLKEVLLYTAPYAAILTETNVPYEDNISYFKDKADMVYQFAFPPLVLDAFNRKDSTPLETLFKRNEYLSRKNIFFNFLASHDGIGVLSAKDVLSNKDYKKLIRTIKLHNGFVSYKSQGGYKMPYELNISYFDALNNPLVSNKYDIDKFMAAQAIILFSRGVPGIYIHSLLGSRNYSWGFYLTGDKRRINREKLDYSKLNKELSNVHTRRGRVFGRYIRLLEKRAQNKLFSPYVHEKIIMSEKRLLIFRRYKGKKGIGMIINLSGDRIKREEYKDKYDVLNESHFSGDIEPYGVYLFKD